MSVDKYVQRIEKATKVLTAVSDLVGRLNEDIREAKLVAVADGADTEARIWDELGIFMGSAGLATEEALNRLSIYGQWIRGGALANEVPTEAEVF